MLQEATFKINSDAPTKLLRWVATQFGKVRITTLSPFLQVRRGKKVLSVMTNMEFH